MLTLVVSLLAGFWSPAATIVPTALASGVTGTNAIWYVGPGGGSAPCDSPDFVVGTAGDGTDGGAIQAAVNGASSGDVVFLCNTTYDLTVPVDVSSATAGSLTFRGESTANTIVDGGRITQLFSAAGKTVSFVGLTLRNGVVDWHGGAVEAASVSIRGASIHDNSAGSAGGAIYATGDVTVTDGTFADNTTGDSSEKGGFPAGGAIFSLSGDVWVTGSTFARHTAPAGGAIAASTGDIRISSTSFTDGTALFGSAIAAVEGSIDISGGSVSHNAGLLGCAVIGASTGDITVRGTTISDNVGLVGGGLCSVNGNIAVTDGTFERNVALIDGFFFGSGGGAIGAGVLRTIGLGGEETGGSVTVTNSHFRQNSSAGAGGAILAGAGVTVIGGSFIENSAGIGGAIFAGTGSSGAGPVSVSGGAEFSSNTAVGVDGGGPGQGGAIHANGRVDITDAKFFSNTSGDDGGAIYIENDNSAGILRSTFSGNRAEGGEGGAIYLGGIALSGPISIEASTFDNNYGNGGGGAIFGGATIATIRNSTFYANVAANAGDGGALNVLSVEVTNGTFLDNTVEGGLGGSVNSGDIHADDSIFSGGTCNNEGLEGSGSFADENSTGCPGTSVTSGDLNLGTLASRGGPTQTINLVSPSVAIDSTAATGGKCLSDFDQRGVARPQAASCDAGAFELSSGSGSIILNYTGPSYIFLAGTATTARVTLSGTITPGAAGCNLRFTLSDGTYYDATTGMKGTGSVLTAPLSIGTYDVVVSAIGDCAGIPDASGVFVVSPDSIGVGTSGGGSYKVDTFTGRVRFAHVVQVKSVTTKVGKTSVKTTTTKGSLLWTYKNVWRLKGLVDYSSTDGSATWGTRSCSTYYGTYDVSSGVCGRFSGSALLQVWDVDADAWVASSYKRVTFVATVLDGGTKSVCSKNKCTTTTYPDYFGIEISSNGVPLTIGDGIPVSAPRSLQSPNGTGSLKAL